MNRIGARYRACAVVLVVAGVFASQASADGPRLIEVSAGKRVWMSQDQIVALAKRSHADGHCGGFMDVTEHPDSVHVPLMPFNAIFGVGPTDPTQQQTVEPLLRELSATKLQDNVAHLSSYSTRYYKSPTGVAAANWIKQQFETYAAGRTDVTVELVTHSFLQPSVIARIQGSGIHANEKVIIGAHEDSVNWSGFGASPSGEAPGADDDASGTSTVLEVFRVLAQSGYRPDRTIEFMTYAGEELGLLGSQDIAQRYRKQKAQVAGVLQLDMTMYPGANPAIALISDYVDAGLTSFLKKLIDTYVKAPWREAKCGYACSDHASWNKAGFPSAFPFEAPLGEDNPSIHTTGDTIQNGLDMAYGLHFAKLGLAFAVEVAGAGN